MLSLGTCGLLLFGSYFGMFFPLFNLTAFVSCSGIVFIGLIYLLVYICEEKKRRGYFFKYLWWKQISLVVPHPFSLWLCRLCSHLTSDFSRTSCCSLPLTAPKWQTDPKPRNISCLCMDCYLQSSGHTGCDFSCWALENSSYFARSFLFPVLTWFQGYCGLFLNSSGTGHDAEVFSWAFYKLCVCAASAETAVKFFAMYWPEVHLKLINTSCSNRKLNKSNSELTVR